MLHPGDGGGLIYDELDNSTSPVEHNFFSPSFSPGNDLCLLSLANHSILSHGTFGMWGALLAGGKTILPRGYEKVKEVKEIRQAHLKDWIFL